MQKFACVVELLLQVIKINFTTQQKQKQNKKLVTMFMKSLILSCAFYQLLLSAVN